LWRGEDRERRREEEVREGKSKKLEK